MKIKALLLVFIALGILLRVYKVMEYPIQLGHDEISQLYDAISVAQTGKDIYGNFLPTMFVSVNDYKSPFYTYATSLVYLLIGGHEWDIKVPGVLFSILTIPGIYFFVRALLKNRTIALIAVFITTIAPFELFYGRKSFENTIGIFFLLIGFGLLIESLEKNKLSKILLGYFCLAFGMYTYFSHAIIIPLLLVVFLFLHKDKVWKFRGNFTKGMLIWVFLIIPLFLIVLFNPGSRYRSQTVFITQDPQLGQKLTNENGFEKIQTIAFYSWQRYLDQFSLDYLFLNGLDLTNQGPLGVGPLMLVDLPFLFIGIYSFIRLQGFKGEKRFVLAWILIGMIPSGLTFEKYSPHRSIMVFTMFDVLTAFGLYQVLTFLKDKTAFWKVSSYTVFSVLLALNFLYVADVYIFSFPKEKAQEIHYPFKQVAEFAKTQRPNVSQIIFDPKFGEVAPRIGTAAHYYMAYYGEISPSEFQREYQLGDASKREVVFGKYSIRAINWAQDSSLKNVLLIASPWVVDPKGIDSSKIIKTFYFPDQTVAFYAIKL